MGQIFLSLLGPHFQITSYRSCQENIFIEMSNPCNSSGIWVLDEDGCLSANMEDPNVLEKHLGIWKRVVYILPFVVVVVIFLRTVGKLWKIPGENMVQCLCFDIKVEECNRVSSSKREEVFISWSKFSEFAYQMIWSISQKIKSSDCILIIKNEVMFFFAIISICALLG